MFSCNLISLREQQLRSNSAKKMLLSEKSLSLQENIIGNYEKMEILIEKANLFNSQYFHE